MSHSRLIPRCFRLPPALGLLGITLLLLAPAAAADLASQRGSFKRALETAENRPPAEFSAVAKRHAGHPLAPYLEYAALRRQLEHIDAARIADFAERHADLPITPLLRSQALHALAKRKDWAGFRQLYRGSSDASLRCADLLSRGTATPDSQWLDAGLELWLHGRSQPALCDEVFARLTSAGRLTPERHLERIELAAAEHNLGLIRFLARALPPPEAALAQSYAAYLEAPTQAPTANWPQDARSRNIAVLGLERLARRDPGAAEALLASLQDRLALDDSQRGQVLNQIALWSAASYLPESAERFTKVPAAAWDERLHEWRAREALARGQLSETLSAIAAMPSEQREQARWRYLAARLGEKTRDPDARARLAELAREPTYFGFLAADRIGAPHALCPLDIEPDAALQQRLQAWPGFVRAMELHAIGRETWARREWDALKGTLPDDERRAAVALAERAGWHDRGAFTLNSGEDLRYYRLRFPLPHQRQIERETKKHGLDPAWVAALIRAESAWIADARSHANARGLMQLLPSTAREEARRRGLRYPGDAGLFDPRENLTLGIAHLATMLERHDQQPFLATAAYNAGPTPVARWLEQRPPSSADIDLWIETIPYRETREYVARILAFSVIYDWQFHGRTIPLQQRATGTPEPTAKPRNEVGCPAPSIALQGVAP
ncbi:MAG: transglycosylase SLT domain-containing protein [Gammaproteobacteria bacterium]|nr:transglycosylase SLT domain-containing protein [Gammaproteobacteria bacterium]